MTPRNTFQDAAGIKICHGDIDYRGIVEHINEGVVIVREGTVIFANSAFYEISQRRPGQVIGFNFSDFAAQGDKEKVTRYCMERLFTEDLSDRIEFVMPGKDRDAIIEMKVNVVECGGSPAILGALTDITGRRKTRNEMQRIKERLESILHSMNEVVVSFSPKDYSILAINPASEALYGVPARDFTNGEMHLIDFVHPDDREKVEEFYRNLPEAEFDEAEYRIISNNKRLKWVLDEGHVVYSSAGTVRRLDHVIKDITDEKKATDALRQSEEKYRDFFESTTDMAFAITPEGVFIDINEAGLKLLGFENKDEALASNVKDFYVDIAERIGLVEEIYGRGHVEGKRLKFRNRAGEEIEVAVTARAKTDDSGRLLYHEGIIHNISQMMEDQRNRVLRNAAGAMCHYLNTHLMHLCSSTDAVGEEMEALDALLERLAAGDDPRDVSIRMNAAMKSMRYFHGGINSAYKKISEVTRAFNKAFLYREESYLSTTILDIFKAHGYEQNDPEESAAERSHPSGV